MSKTYKDSVKKRGEVKSHPHKTHRHWKDESHERKFYHRTKEKQFC